ncbi:MAG: hypothetical protein JXA68_08600 [Ignavibacteriales bacterium]|nr:hypothetical protein [Ignavibacteriales bacterium]
MKKTILIISILFFFSICLFSQIDGELIDTTESMMSIEPNQTINDDLYLIGSLGLGDGMIEGYSFGYNTIAMVENNLRILFEDNSTQVGFPTNDWQIEINSSLSGADSYFRINDITNVKSPFTIQANSPSDALVVETSTGDIGLGTSTPSTELHIKDGDSPAIRLEQSGSIWTPQTWDIAGNETNFFVRDVTYSSKLPFRIQPNTPNNTLTLKNSGNVGIGTWEQEHTLEVVGDMQVNSYFYFGDESTDGNWRVSVVSGKLTFEKREGGVWVTKIEME